MKDGDSEVELQIHKNSFLGLIQSKGMTEKNQKLINVKCLARNI